MRIKRLEIKGFKSFPDKTIVDFEQNITGIVGPNGCGKSNIVDAIRWVIGEQKISVLRSEKLDSLVFNGSKSRSPSSLAEVAITFEKTRNLVSPDFDTITITRRFFKSGESAYELNGISCRLKDIQNLLLDTGVSTDSYAIIELGMIDDIIKNKDNSRGEMLEQAAGISIFKTRKKETEKKLLSTENNLKRLEDILFEIRNQLKELESQAKKAKRYAELKAQYKEKSVLYAQLVLKSINGQQNKQQEALTHIQEQLASLKTSHQTMDNELEEKKIVLEQHHQTLQNDQQILSQTEKRATELKTKNDLTLQTQKHVKEKLKENTQFIESTNHQINQLNETLTLSQKEIEQEASNTHNEKETLSIKEQEVAELKHQLVNTRQSIREINLQIQEIQSGQHEVEKRMAVFESKILNSKQSNTQAQERVKNTQEETKNLLQDKETLNQQLTKDQAILENKKKELESQKKNILSLQEKLEKERGALNEKQRKLDAKQNEYGLLKNLIDSLEGYPESVKFIHQNSEWETAPLFSDILIVDSEYKACIESYLEDFMNYYVVSQNQQAKQAIKLLQKNSKGKVRFFSLDEQTKLQTSSPSIAPPQNCIIASTVIKVNKEYQQLINHLLHNVFITKGKELFHIKSATILEKSGQWMTQPWRISGGSVGAFEGSRIGRVQNLYELEGEIKQQQQITDRQKSSIQKIQEEIARATEKLQEKQIEHLQDILIKKQQDIQILSEKNQQKESVIKENNEHIKLEEIQITSWQEDMSEQKKKLVEQKESERIKQQEKKESESILSKQEKNIELIQQKLGEIHILYTKYQNNINSLQREDAYKKQQRQQLQDQLEEKAQEQEIIRDQIIDISEEIKKVEEQTVSLLQSKESVQKEVNLSVQEFDRKRQEIAEQEAKLRKLNQQKDPIEKKERELIEKGSEIQLKATSIKERLKIEFNLNVDNIIDKIPPKEEDSNEAEIIKRTETIKQLIDRIGEVNPMAIEAFETHKKRYDFMMEQKSDLEEAKANLLQTINEVEATASQRFQETFNQVKTYFERVFKTLFTQEDQAELKLQSPENFSETGVNIIAKPKGKKPVSIDQLSGGEKTLTSIAFLFSLYLIKPAPFCVLDEVDAPLDDANVSKFSAMIKEFSEESQFIIVTHNKTTMSNVDVIYGVTMQETGVSKLVPVDFRSLA